MTSARASEALRFLIAGGINTAATYALYLLLLEVVHYTLAYSIAYVAGIVLAYLLNTAFVFRVRRSAGRAALFPLVYVVQYVLGIAVLMLLVRLGAASERLAPLAVIAITVPVNYVLSRMILMPPDSSPDTSRSAP